jgi:hypothetical protein
MQTAFSDANGWSWPQYYRTLQYVDFDRDGHTDICARGSAGIVCSVWRPAAGFAPPVVWTLFFNDTTGFSADRYYPSIRIADINGDGSPDVCGRGIWGLYCVINPSPPGQLTMPTRSGLGQPEMTDAARWGLPSELLDSLHIVDFDRDGKRDVCGLVQLSAQGSPDFLCSHSLSPATVPLFAALVKRTGSVITLEKVVAGRLYDTPGTPRAMGFCWTTLTRSVSCSAEWR